MTRLIRAELLKLATMRVTYGMILLALAVGGLFASLEASGAGRRVASVSTVSGLTTVTTTTGFANIIAAVLGVILVSGEFRHGSATLTYLATPARGRVLAAKTVAAAAGGALLGLLAGLVALGIGLGFVAADGYQVTLGTGTLIGHVGGAMLGGALLAAAGAAAGALIRSQLGAVIGVFVWCLVAESILGRLFGSVQPYLPYTVSTTVAGAPVGAGSFGPGYRISTEDPLPLLAGAGLLAGIAAVLALVAARTTVRQDVT